MVLDAQSLENLLRVLIVSDGKAGHENQSIAFAKLKNADFDIIKVKKHFKALDYLFDWLGIYVNFLKIEIPNKRYKAVVSAGSSTYYFNKVISKKLNIPSIAIMYPKGFKLNSFDYILANEHDNPPTRANIITLPINLSYTSPNGYIKKQDKKAVGIIIGGDNDIFAMEKDQIKKQLDKIFKEYPHHLKYITTSRRTPKEVEELIESYGFDYRLIYSKNPHINPIPDFIKVCDDIFITIDSTSMLSEAKANSDASIHIVDLKSNKQNTKYHKLAKIVKELKGRFDYTPYLNRIKI